MVIPMSTGIACGLAIGKEIKYEKVMQKYKKYKKHYQNDQQTIQSFNKLYRKDLQDSVIDQSENESLCIVFTEHLDETKIESFS